MKPIAFAGVADKNPSLFRRLRVALGDPAAWIDFDGKRIALVRDIEQERVGQHATVDEVVSPSLFSPAGGLDPDRETATAQALAELIRRHGATEVWVDRTFPYIFAHHVLAAGIVIHYDPEQGVNDRRTKTESELESLAAAQSVTESVMQRLCSTVAMASAIADGTLFHDGAPLTSQRVRTIAAEAFLQLGYTMPHGAIVATTPDVGDCHHAGEGPLKTGQSIVIDLFPRCEATRYWGDCTRTVVHGTPSDAVVAMHRAVIEAKAAACQSLVTGRTAASVHEAANKVLTENGFPLSRGIVTDHASIQHGTGHGIGLDLHEPILLDDGGGEMLENEVFTVEPGLYGRKVGGVRVEDMLVVTRDGPQNFNRLPDTLDWRT